MNSRLIALIILLVAFCLDASQRPNIVWIIGEDMGPELGCYGDRNAITPNMDRLAKEGARYTRCFTHAPVCAPSRFGLITGNYPTTVGAHHMRSQVFNPTPMFTEYLKEAGYTICWPKSYGKMDFNFEVPKNAFDRRDDWTKNKPPEPFFGYFNITTSHESRIRSEPVQFAKLTEPLKPSERQDPAKMELPPYHPDDPKVRRDLANYYELVTAVDYKVGEVLEALDRWNMATNTIVVFFGDHGRGLPRSKRWVYDSGIHVPLIVRWPGQIKPGEVRDELVSFIDFAPTMLNVAGVKSKTNVLPDRTGKPPKRPTFQGNLFLGPGARKRDYIFAARDRMDETYDRIRAVRDERFKYIRNFEPDLPYSQRVAYGEEMPSMQVWREWNDAGKLNPVQKLFFAPTKPTEELYDCETDPHEVKNLANDPKYAKKLKELRRALDKWLEETKDLGAVQETELIKLGLVADRLSTYESRKTEGLKK